MKSYHELGGKTRPVLFGFGAAYIFEQQTGKNALQMIDAFAKGEGNISDIVSMIFAGLLNGAEDDGLEVDFTAADVARWLSKAPTLVPVLLEQFAESFSAGAGDEGGEQKKRSPRGRPRRL
ncbi:MAG: hypothetical protein KatS3mg031_2993 [Chitinophagales bacterium]|nr:MAG: hypothetical protein KatS3mg031_2922 [Chitinophagales bacterium]GIV35458.1 MAG: hypothetical protein KatS3mg031_2993 [Chitinophagales bacterium]